MMRGATGALLLATLAAVLVCSADAYKGLYGRTIFTYNRDALARNENGWQRRAPQSDFNPDWIAWPRSANQRQGHDSDDQNDFGFYPSPARRIKWQRAPLRRDGDDGDDDDPPPPGNFDEIDGSPLDMGH